MSAAKTRSDEECPDMLDWDESLENYGIYISITSNNCSKRKQVLSNIIRRLCKVPHLCFGESNKFVHGRVIV